MQGDWQALLRLVVQGCFSLMQGPGHCLCSAIKGVKDSKMRQELLVSMMHHVTAIA